MQRRKFIQLSVLSSLAIGVVGINCGQPHPANSALLDKPEILSQICDLKTLREIGTAYRVQIGSDKNSEKLQSLLLTDSAGNPISSDSSSQFVQTLVKQKINQDFESGNTVIVRGWVLAVTEARQCALLSFNAQQ